MKKSIFKRICACFVMLLVFASSITLLVGCGKDDEEKKIMNLDVNPSVEFVLDGKDKVVSVNATNAEGNYILTEVNFVGLTAKDAVNKFLEIAKTQGFIIPGEVNFGENTFTISISGDDAEDLYNQVKNSASEYLSGLNVNITIAFEELDEDYLESLVAECMQELTVSQIDEMDEEELVELIKASRDETKQLFSEELKDLYYQTRAEELVKSKFDAIINLLRESSLSPLINTALNNLSTSLDSFKTQLDNFKTTFKNNYLSGTYKQELQNVIDAKKALLEERMKSTVDQQVISNLETALSTAEAGLQSAKTQVENVIDVISGQLDTLVASLNTTLDSILAIVSNFLDDSQTTISNAINTAKTNFKTSFETEFAEELASAKTMWESLKPSEPVAV